MVKIAGSAAPSPRPSSTDEVAPSSPAPAAPERGTPSVVNAGAAPEPTRVEPNPEAGRAARVAHSAQSAQLAQQLHAGHTHAGPTAHAHAEGFAPAGQSVGGPGPARPAASTFATREAGVAALDRDFGVRVRDGNPAFSPEELSRVHESYSRMSSPDREALRGLDLRREHTASAAIQQEAGGHGTLAGLYSPNADARPGTGERVQPASITLYDSAFPSGPQGRQSSIHTITHEAGHAVEGRRRDDATAALNGTIERRNAAVPVLNDANDANNAAVGTFNRAAREAGRNPGTTAAERSQSRQVASTQNAVNRANEAVGTARTPEALAAARTRQDTAVAARDAALGRMSATHPGRAATEEMVRASDNWGSAARARGEANVPLTQLSAEQSAARANVGRFENSAHVSNELSDFQRSTRTARGHEQPISDYGATGPAEDYAESYALYRRDPAFMQEHYPRTFQWFQRQHP